MREDEVEDLKRYVQLALDSHVDSAYCFLIEIAKKLGMKAGPKCAKNSKKN